MALAHILQQVSTSSAVRFEMVAYIVDHNHRPESSQEAELVSRRLEKLGAIVNTNIRALY
jgi:tRNA(Ile)-lysidine synthase TilS/MesJ